MKVTSLECIRVDMPLLVPYTISYETIGHSTNFFLHIITDSGMTGWGCAAPDLEVTGETPDSVTETFRQVIEPLLRGADPFRHAYFNEELRRSAAQSPSARAMVNMALYDILAHKAELPLYKCLGGYRDSIPTSITIGILPLSETLEQAVEFRKKGFSILKIKGGVNVEEDIEKMIRIREILGNEAELRFDANQGYSVEDSVHFIEATLEADIEILEQPTAREKHDQLGEVTHRVSAKVMADESLMDLNDAFMLTSNEYVDMVNIKLMKVGGISEAMHINSVAKAAGVEVMVGCMDESALGISAGLHFALSRPNITHADLDGHLDLLNDPFQGIIELRQGLLCPTDKPGLGAVEMKV